MGQPVYCQSVRSSCGKMFLKNFGTKNLLRGADLENLIRVTILVLIRLSKIFQM